MKYIEADEIVGGHVYGLHEACRVAGIWTETAASYRTEWVDRLGRASSALCGLLRDVFGPLLFRPVFVDAAWLDSAVVKIARSRLRGPSLRPDACAG